MRFLQPSQLLWALVALVPLLLYLFRRKPRRVPVSTLIFFKSLAREHRESAWLRWLKRILSLLLTLLVIAGAVGALARMVVSPPAGAVKSIVIVVDRSASMAAQDDRGQTRLDIALSQVRARLAGLSSGVSVMLLAFDRQTEVVASKSYDRRVVGRALDSLKVRPIEGDSETALRLAGQLAALEKPAAIWFVSDAPAPSGGEVAVESIAVPLGAPRNVGLTAFDIRRVPLEPSRCETYVQLQSTHATDAKVEVRIDGTLTAVRELTLPAGGRESLLLPIEPNAGKLLSVRAIAKGDQLPGDDEVIAHIPEPRTLKVLWITEKEKTDPFTQIALTALSREGELAVFRADPTAWPPKEAVDLVIFQNWLPSEWPVELPVIVIDPPNPLGPIQMARLGGAGLPVERLRATRERHPLLYGVATGRLILTQTTVLAAEGALEPLWSGPAGPLLAAGEARGQRVVVLGFAPEQSENLPLSASYPLLLGNAIQWVAQPKVDAGSAPVQHSGDLVAMRGKSFWWTKPDGTADLKQPIRNGWALLDRAGRWQTDAGESGSAALLSSRETLLPAGTTAPEAGVASRRLRGDLGWPLVWLVLAVLVLESWLFHRHAVH